MPDEAGSSNVAHRIHVLPVTVFYEDTDAAAVVYYANYLRYAERARTKLLHDIGFTNTGVLERDGIAFAVRHVDISYERPALLEDHLEVRTRVMRLGRASIVLEQNVYRGDDVITLITVTLACMKLEGGVAKIPDDVRTGFEAWLA